MKAFYAVWTSCDLLVCIRELVEMHHTHDKFDLLNF